MPYGTVNAEQMTTQSGFTLGAGNASSFKNRIINGAMVIAQRGTGTTSNTFVNQVDQFQVASNSSATFTFGQSSTAPTGFIKSALNTNTSAITLTGTNYYQIRNVIEGLNIADLGWGTANAKAVTLSFWVYSSLTGSFGGSIFNGSANYSYPFLYTVSSANTWTQISVSIAGPTAGTWATDNGTGMFIEWSLGCGSTYLGTAGAWAASRFQGATGQVQLSQTNGATFYITGAQLEVGTVATSFDYRSYGTEFSLCQRYYQTYAGMTVPFNPAGSNGNNGYLQMVFPVVMRSAPSVSATSVSVKQNATSYAYTISSVATITTGMTEIFGTATTNPGYADPTVFYFTTLNFSSEL